MNWVFGRASTIRPSVTIGSSLATRTSRDDSCARGRAPGLAALKNPLWDGPRLRQVGRGQTRRVAAPGRRSERGPTKLNPTEPCQHNAMLDLSPERTEQLACSHEIRDLPSHGPAGKD